MKRFITAILVLLCFHYVSAPVYAVNANIDEARPQIDSETAVLIDASTGQVLYQKDMDKRMYPASITKIMTALLALKYGQLSDMITMSHDAVFSVDRDSANIALDVGEQLTLEQALYALSVASANDAANGIAEYIGGTIDGFIEMMNSAAKEAGAVHTQFINANGLPDDDHYTTAYDMAVITAEALNLQGFSEIFSIKRCEIPPTNKQPETRILNSSNRLVNGDISYEGTLMSKAGWTVQAQHTLVTAASRNGTTLVAVVMKSSDSTVKWSDTVALLDYGFEQFTPVTVTEQELLRSAPEELSPTDSDGSRIDPDSFAAEDISILLPAGATLSDVKITYGQPFSDANDGSVRIPVSLSIPAAGFASEPLELFETTVKASLLPEELEPAAAGPEPAVKKISPLIVVLIAFAAVIVALLLIFVVLLIRRALIRRMRKRRKQRQKIRQFTK